MSPNRAPGPDHFTSDICEAAFSAAPEILRAIFNACLAAGRFPTSWKVAEVKALRKPGKEDYSELGSYRPIGLLPVFGKLLEKVIVRRLTYSAQVAGSWSPNQFGFREQRSTVTALHELLARVKTAKSHRAQVLAVSLDIKGAFDNAWWPALMERLRKTNCARNVHRLLADYLANRVVRLQLAGTSHSKVTTKGCIQGSVFGPTLWNLILDDLLEMTLPPECHLQAYADDVILLVSAPTAQAAQLAANKALTMIRRWGASQKLQFGADKTVAVSFSPGSRHVRLAMGTAPITMSPQMKLLGVIIDQNLKFTDHAKYIIAKATKIFQRLCKFVRPTWGVSPANVETIYHGVIEPTVTYAAGIWGECAQRYSIKQLLTRFQRSFATRAIRAFHTVSATSALALAQFIPLHLKIGEVCALEQVKLAGTFDHLPSDLELERRIAPEEKLHPAYRQVIGHYLAHTQEDVDALSQTVNIYTDGSKQENGDTGAAFVVFTPDRPPVERKFKLHRVCTVFQAEVYAIHRAVEWVAKTGAVGVTIFSDSRSALAAIAQWNNDHPLVIAIQKTIRALGASSPAPVLAWVKAHVGIAGNELADAAAKAATEKRSAKDYDDFPFSFVKRALRQRTLHLWEQEYASATTGAITRRFFPTIADARRAHAVMEPTFETTQIFTGHSFARAYLHRFKIAQTPTCPCNMDAHQTVHHLLEECPRYAQARYLYEGECAQAKYSALDYLGVLADGALAEKFYSFAKYIIDTLKALNA